MVHLEVSSDSAFPSLFARPLAQAYSPSHAHDTRKKRSTPLFKPSLASRRGLRRKRQWTSTHFEQDQPSHRRRNAEEACIFVPCLSLSSLPPLSYHPLARLLRPIFTSIAHCSQALIHTPLRPRHSIEDSHRWASLSTLLQLAPHRSHSQQMTLGSMDADRFVRALAEENAQLRALLQNKTELPPSPPTTAADCSSEPITPLDPLPDPLIKVSGGKPKQPAMDDDDDASPLRTIIELLRVQIASQAAAQDTLLDQLGQLRTSHANLQAATSDVTDELVVLREKSSRLAEQVEREKDQRKALEEEKAAEADKVATLRSKMEESRRAIMRLQDESAARRASESRRGSAVLLTPLTGDPHRRGSLVATPGQAGSAVLENRRASLMAGGIPAVPPLRRASIAVCDANASSPTVGLGLDLAGSTASPAVEPSPRPAGKSHHRRAQSIASTGAVKMDAPLDERLTALRTTHRSASAAADLDPRRRHSLAPLEEDTTPPSVIRRPHGSLSRGAPPARSSISGNTRRRPSNGMPAMIKGSSLAQPDDEAAILRAQMEALQRRLAEVEAAGGPTRTLQDYVLAPSPKEAATPAFATAPVSRRQSTVAAFGSFSFQSRGRNPALVDTPPSPSSGSYSPGGSRREEPKMEGPFGGTKLAVVPSAPVSDEEGERTAVPAGAKKGEEALQSLMERCESAEKAVEEAK